MCSTCGDVRRAVWMLRGLAGRKLPPAQMGWGDFSDYAAAAASLQGFVNRCLRVKSDTRKGGRPNGHDRIIRLGQRHDYLAAASRAMPCPRCEPSSHLNRLLTLRALESNEAIGRSAPVQGGWSVLSSMVLATATSGSGRPPNRRHPICVAAAAGARPIPFRLVSTCSSCHYHRGCRQRQRQVQRRLMCRWSAEYGVAPQAVYILA